MDESESTPFPLRLAILLALWFGAGLFWNWLGPEAGALETGEQYLMVLTAPVFAAQAVSYLWRHHGGDALLVLPVLALFLLHAAVMLTRRDPLHLSLCAVILLLLLLGSTVAVFLAYPQIAYAG